MSIGYTVEVTRTDGTKDNPIFSSEEAAKRAVRDYESLGYTAKYHTTITYAIGGIVKKAWDFLNEKVTFK